MELGMKGCRMEDHGVVEAEVTLAANGREALVGWRRGARVDAVLRRDAFEEVRRLLEG